MNVAARVLGSATLCASLWACTFGSPIYKTYNEAPGADEVVTGTVCDSPTVAADLGTLTACGGGHGHCYDKTRVPGVGTLPTDGCDAAKEVCVPDKILTANGSKLKSCASLIGPGACVSTIVVEINQNKGALGSEGCDPDEACVPCVDPQHDNAPTPFCLDEGIGVHEAACVTTDGTQKAAQKCCLNHEAKPVGVCIQKDGVPEGQRGSVSQDLCKSADEACVPEALTRGEFVKCSAGYSGVCVDPCFVGLTNSKLLLTGGCKDGTVCVPCLFGKGQGLPGCQGEPDP
jgi:hypothetical protein